MNEIKRKSRVNRAIQVIQKTEAGMSVTNACKDIGIPRSTFYYIVESEQEYLTKIQDMIFMSNIGNLGLILDNQTPILEKIIGDGLSDNTKPRERIAIYKSLVQRSEALLQFSQTSRRAKNVMNERFNGPRLEHGSSNFSSNLHSIENGDNLQVK